MERVNVIKNHLEMVNVTFDGCVVSLNILRPQKLHSCLSLTLLVVCNTRFDSRLRKFLLRKSFWNIKLFLNEML